MTMSEEKREGQIIAAMPVFRVPDAVAAAKYYCDVLGFEQKFSWGGDPPWYVIVRRDELEIHLTKTGDPAANIARASGPATNTDLYVIVRDADALYAELTERGAETFGPPATEAYGMRDFQVRDLNGYVICFGQDVGEGD
jgi:uncharacterized glyoxalase superfamily protein PhnB